MPLTTTESAHSLPIAVREGPLFPMRPAFEAFLPRDGIGYFAELRQVNELERPAVVRIAIRIVAKLVFTDSPLRIVRHADVERAVEAAQHVDVVHSHA